MLSVSTTSLEPSVSKPARDPIISQSYQELLLFYGDEGCSRIREYAEKFFKFLSGLEPQTTVRQLVNPDPCSLTNLKIEASFVTKVLDTPYYKKKLGCDLVFCNDLHEFQKLLQDLKSSCLSEKFSRFFIIDNIGWTESIKRQGHCTLIYLEYDPTVANSSLFLISDSVGGCDGGFFYFSAQIIRQDFGQDADIYFFGLQRQYDGIHCKIFCIKDALTIAKLRRRGENFFKQLEKYGVIERKVSRLGESSKTVKEVAHLTAGNASMVCKGDHHLKKSMSVNYCLEL